MATPLSALKDQYTQPVGRIERAHNTGIAAHEIPGRPRSQAGHKPMTPRESESQQVTGAPGALLGAILLAGKSSVNARSRQHPISGTDKPPASAISAGDRPAGWTRTHPLY